MKVGKCFFCGRKSVLTKVKAEDTVEEYVKVKGKSLCADCYNYLVVENRCGRVEE